MSVKLVVSPEASCVSYTAVEILKESFQMSSNHKVSKETKL
jgi:hypothetical protein